MSNIAEAIHTVLQKHCSIFPNNNIFRIGNTSRSDKKEAEDTLHDFIMNDESWNRKKSAPTKKRESYAPSKEDVGRATWTFLHTLAAQYPDKPSFQQKRDAKQLIDILTRMYPCGECAEHFTQVVKAHPPVVSSREEFSQWMCRVHNVVNRSIGKPEFNCRYISSRWQGIDCDTPSACKLLK